MQPANGQGRVDLGQNLGLIQGCTAETANGQGRVDDLHKSLRWLTQWCTAQTANGQSIVDLDQILNLLNWMEISDSPGMGDLICLPHSAAACKTEAWRWNCDRWDKKAMPTLQNCLLFVAPSSPCVPRYRCTSSCMNTLPLPAASGDGTRRPSWTQTQPFPLKLFQNKGCHLKHWLLANGQIPSRKGKQLLSQMSSAHMSILPHRDPHNPATSAGDNSNICYEIGALRCLQGADRVPCRLPSVQ